jgi:membrane protein
MSKWLKVLKDTVSAWVDDFAPSMGAAISYYTMFSLAPLLVLVIAIAGLVFGAEAVQGQISTQLSSLMGQDTAEAVEGMVESASLTGNGWWATAVSIVILLVGATSVFAELQSALDRIWHVPESAKPSGLWGILRSRLFSLGLILGLAFLLMVSLAVSAGLAAFGSLLGGLLPGQEVLLQVLNVLVSFSVMGILFAMIFKWMPTVPVAWRDVWVGAAVTAALFEVGKFGIGLYLGKSGLSDSFAGAGALVILLAWVYYAAQIFLLGAEFTKVYAHSHGSAQQTAAASEAKGDQPQGEPAKAAQSGGDQTRGDQVPTKESAPEQPKPSNLLVTPAELDRRLAQASAQTLPKLAMLGILAMLRVGAEKRIKKEKKLLRSRRQLLADRQRW